MKKKKSFKKNSLNIIGGKFKRKKINIKHSNELRPTKNFIRETLFNWLKKYIYNSKCLDCFSGSGILGIESISRNAKLVTALEINKKHVQYIKKNLKKLKIKKMKVIHANTVKWLYKKKFQYDIIFLDPPYNNNYLLKKSIFLLEKKKWIKKNGIIYIEKKRNKKKIIIPKNWIIKKKKKTKKIEYKIYLKK
ncbi:MAG: 16S rRNA (guanine(966)-N(2))-methyltransferase RsmD [Buchnera aphidicola (Periphyllus lyropictus)]|uniref:16S rRNA (guanine(966)-N(2))-methyltransferase RsmD n=1 Tax=Buchnera aphidicola TaxID=9 RepID=UPI001EBF0021|nr:16S rRNA (guanine(966)-N(2))-methyltransferase RsmD [Buchnera aphidicola]NIH16784.1 16S rRNA (guanine(966)-N(2))-methyltransferase RsmD [Buchnera aphidicola (Periphyllus lyropictus)]USS94680.1 16S rRNA (guanine(966)-N(2))-methyltransferase RsmD [Buchnera aphidicola (Periphyllus lyropictus)]